MGDCSWEIGLSVGVEALRACWREGRVSYLREMNFDLAGQFSVGELFSRAIGMVCLGGFLGFLLAVFLHAGLHALGFLRLRKGAKHKPSICLALIALCAAAFVGAATGFVVGVAHAALVVARDIGPKVLQTSAENALREAGVKDFANFDSARLRELLEQAGKAELPALPAGLAERLRPEMELSRAKLIEQAKAWLDTQGKDGPLAVAEVVTTFWPKLLVEMVSWERQFRRVAIVHGVLWVLACEVSLALFCALSRGLRAPVESETAIPPKLQ